MPSLECEPLAPLCLAVLASMMACSVTEGASGRRPAPPRLPIRVCQSLCALAWPCHRLELATRDASVQHSPAFPRTHVTHGSHPEVTRASKQMGLLLHGGVELAVNLTAEPPSPPPEAAPARGPRGSSCLYGAGPAAPAAPAEQAAPQGAPPMAPRPPAAHPPWPASECFPCPRLQQQLQRPYALAGLAAARRPSSSSSSTPPPQPEAAMEAAPTASTAGSVFGRGQARPPAGRARIL